MKTRFAAAATALAATTSCVGCGGSTSAAGTPPANGAGSSATPSAARGSSAANVSACTAVAQPDAAALTGDPDITSISETSGAAGVASTCIYADPSNPTAGNGVVVLVESLSGVISAQVLEAALAQQTRNGANAYEPVDGVGDRAYSETDSNQGNLVFSKGSTLVVIAATSLSRTGAELLTAVETLAMRIASQL